MQIMEIAVAVFYDPLVLSYIHLNYVNLNVKPDVTAYSSKARWPP